MNISLQNDLQLRELTPNSNPLPPEFNLKDLTFSAMANQGEG